ncbi:MAG TPA: prepilin-type N-terminal cleavage/methylation domain-containing protein [Methylomirabilota bacterium]|nr:prepilin-type N-terminal cleavage/methylation domain-containing protein [Methylomirabilota bacterium]
MNTASSDARGTASRRGFTLVEVLIASAMSVVGLTAVAAGFQHALNSAEVGRLQTTALFLAEQRLEQVKAMALVDFDGLTAGSFPGEASVVGYPQYRRRVDFTPGPQGLTGAVRVQVTVEYQSMTTGPRMVTLATVLSRR